MKETLARIQEYPVEDWIVWAGAGISFPHPTSLPLGDRLTQFCIRETCGEAVVERVVELWARVKSEVQHVEPSPRFYDLPRLETVLGAFADAERGAPQSLQFLRGFSSFASAPPNLNHLLLASLVRRGATVVTTNFDLGIERALESPSGSVVRVVRDEGMLRAYRPDGAGCGEVIHVHGVADDVPQLGATLTQVKQGMAEPFRRFLEERLDRGAVLVFVGYSASDAFDVTPYFRSRPERVWPHSTMVFAQHRGSPIPSQVRELKRGFGDYVPDDVDTTTFLVSLCRQNVLPPAEEGFDWVVGFSRALSDFRADEARPLLVCALANALGVNVDRLDELAFGAAQARNPGYRAWEYHTVLALAARGRGTEALEAEHHLRAGGQREDLLGYHFARGQMIRARRLALSVSEILARAGGPGAIDWKPYTSLSVHARMLLAPFVLLLRLRGGGWLRQRAARLARRATERLMRAASLLAERDLADVAAIHQVATALRFRLLFSCLQNGVLDQDLEERILTLYSEQSHLAGFVSSFRDFALARLFLLGYAAPRDPIRLAGEAGQMLDRSRSIARRIGDARSERRADGLLRLVRSLELRHGGTASG